MNHLFWSQRNVSTSPMLSKSSYAPLFNRLVLSNLLRQPTVWHPIQMSNPFLFVLCNTVLDNRKVHLFMNAFIVESISSFTAFNRWMNLVTDACILCICFSPEPKLQNHTIRLAQPLPYKILVMSFFLLY